VGGDVLSDNKSEEAPSPNSAAENRGSAVSVGWRVLLSERNAAVSVMLAGGVAIHALSLRVVATVLPSVVAEIGGLQFFAWTTTVAMVSSIWGAALAAPLTARGLKVAYRVSLVVFATGSIFCAVAPSMGILLVGRFFQGLGGGLLTALAYTTIRRVFPEALRTRAIVLVSGIWGVAALCGPLLGGVLAAWGFWRWAFWLDIPVAAAVGLLAEHALPKSVAKDDRGSGLLASVMLGRLSLLGASVLAVAVGGVGGRAIWSGIGLMVGGVLLITLLRMEQASGAASFRLMPTGVYRLHNVVGAVSLAMALMAGSIAAVLYLPYVATEAGGYSPIFGGYLSGIVALSWTTASFISASAVQEWAKRSIFFGAALVALGMMLTAWALIVWSFVFVALALVLVGGGIGIAWAHLGTMMMAHARETEHDVSSAFISTNQMLAQAFASALAGMIANIAGFADPGLTPSAVARAVAWVFLSFSIFAAAALPPSVISVRLSDGPLGKEPNALD
jgi:MFS family permease